jgi:polysaccharide chain length determinant protein (PEP-CTERM system associated)
VSPALERLMDEVHGAWRYRWAGLAAAWLVAVLAWVYVFALPDNYEASSRVFVDTRTVLRPALQGLALNEDLNAELNYVRQALLAGSQLQKIAQEAGMLPADASAARKQDVLTGLVSRTQIAVRSASEHEEDRSAGNIYRISYQDPDRALSLKVVKILTRDLVSGTLGSTHAESESAQRFLETQLHDYEARLSASEAKLAAFKSAHLGVMPTEAGGYFAQLQKENGLVEDTQNKLRTAESRRATLERQLRGDAVVSAVGTGSTSGGGNGGDTLSRIAETQAHLDDLLLRFTDKHPDVIAARSTLDELKKRRAAEIESLRRGDAGAAATSRASASPVYQGIALALNQAEVDISDLSSELADHRAKAQELRKMLNTAPQVEAQYAQLARDYDVNRQQYTSLLENYDKTRLGQRANDAGSVRFTLVQPPSVGSDPVSPDRPLLLVGVLLVALAAGIGAAYGLNLLQPVAGSARALAALTGTTILGVVGNAFPARTARAARRDSRRVCYATACLVAVFAVILMISNAGWRVSLPFWVNQ